MKASPQEFLWPAVHRVLSIRAWTSTGNRRDVFLKGKMPGYHYLTTLTLSQLTGRQAGQCFTCSLNLSVGNEEQMNSYSIQPSIHLSGAHPSHLLELFESVCSAWGSVLAIILDLGPNHTFLLTAQAWWFSKCQAAVSCSVVQSGKSPRQVFSWRIWILVVRT